MVNMHNWMTISSYEDLRNSFILNNEIVVMAHLGAHAFETIGGEIVQTTAFVSRKGTYDANGVYYNLVDSSDKEKDFFLVKDGEPTKDSLDLKCHQAILKNCQGALMRTGFRPL